MEPGDVAVAIARGRMALGAAGLAAPALAARVMFGRRSGPGAATFARMLGGRDIALGLGVVIALDRGAPVRGWLEACALADSVDLLACLLARDDIPRSTLGAMVALAGATALTQAWLSRELDPAPPASPGHPEAMATGHPPERVSATPGEGPPAA
jgi:hypothetical protein